MRRPVVVVALAAVLAGCSASPSGGPAAELPSLLGAAAVSAPALSSTAPSGPAPSAESSAAGSAPSTRSSRSTTRTSAPAPPSPRRATTPTKNTPLKSTSRKTPPRTTPPTTTAAPPRPPTVGAPLTVTAADRRDAVLLVRAMTTDERAGSVIMPAATQATGTLVQNGWGGVILMGSKGQITGTSAGSPAQVLTLTRKVQAERSDRSAPPLLIGTDQEYGDVTRLVNGFTDFPGASVLAATGDPALTERVATAAAAEMRAVGVTVDFAPDADVLPTDGDSAIGDRSYGSDPQAVAQFVAAAVRGYQAGGVAATIKHFPGIGGIATDTHTALPSLDTSCAEWNGTERVPMAAGVDAGAAIAMTGHVLFPAVGVDEEPASLSSSVVTDLLRGKGIDGCDGLGFRGVTVSDSLQMTPVTDLNNSGEAAWRALAAGQELLLLPLDPVAARTGLVTAVRTGDLDPERLEQAAISVMTLRLATARVAAPSLDVVGSAPHRDLAARARG